MVLAPITEVKEGANLPCSIPATKATHSTIPTTSPPPSAKRLSHCQPYCVVNASPVSPNLFSSISSPPFSSVTYPYPLWKKSAEDPAVMNVIPILGPANC